MACIGFDNRGAGIVGGSGGGDNRYIKGSASTSKGALDNGGGGAEGGVGRATGGGPESGGGGEEGGNGGANDLDDEPIGLRIGF